MEKEESSELNDIMLQPGGGASRWHEIRKCSFCFTSSCVAPAQGTVLGNESTDPLRGSS